MIGTGRLFVAAWSLLFVILFGSALFGQNQQQVRQAFVDLRDDNVPLNCTEATAWLYKNRESLRDQLLEEMYRTNDAQARTALLSVLLSTRSLNPDERFARFLMQRLRVEDARRYVEPPASDADVGSRGVAAQDDSAWVFVNDHYAVFEPLLKAEITRTDDMLELWTIAWLMKKRGVLSDDINLFSEEVLRKAGTNLKDDNKWCNAAQAARFFLIFPNQSLPILREFTQSADAQQRSLSRALIDAISNGNREAFGFISFKCCALNTVPFGESVPEPKWLSEIVAKDQDADKQTYP